MVSALLFVLFYGLLPLVVTAVACRAIARGYKEKKGGEG
ncbi:Hypothetical Protein RradSPS_2928 (plasmid) [Rubrobacter radiotolerans]|uniref:Uncharacterized protein n=1 Tax=Rubrobacter radiotolerans TaxID=42256 RepID=A0A023X7M0_RUBRA|nr:Hypothetical Protein RradSPS_2928 [Rubrobacter radiotolerans]SMC01874.1 hypothetical protein SAMN00767673_3025 [Rubrobacter radiotolerans DSM 5868]